MARLIALLVIRGLIEVVVTAAKEAIYHGFAVRYKRA